MPQSSASFDELLRQAPMTAGDYMRNAIDSIDSRFGDGFSAKHPELVGAFMQTAAQDYHTAIIAQQIREGLLEAGTTVSQGIHHALNDAKLNA